MHKPLILPENDLYIVQNKHRDTFLTYTEAHDSQRHAQCFQNFWHFTTVMNGRLQFSCAPDPRPNGKSREIVLMSGSDFGINSNSLDWKS